MPQNLIKNLQKTQKQYVMDSLYCTDYTESSGEVEITNSLTDKGKLQYVASALKTEAFYDNNIKRFGGNRPKIIADHLQGLPSYVNVPFENYKIIKKGKEWGYDLSTESKEDKFCENWWINIASKLTQLMEKHGVEIKKYPLDELDFNDGMKKVEESKEEVEKYLDENLSEKVAIAEHDNGTFLYFNPELKNEVNKALEPLLSYKSLDSLVKSLDNKPEFSGLNNQDLEYLGFKKARDLKLGNEYHIEFSPEILEKLKDLGYSKTWGHEGLTNAYATFRVDNKDHEDYGKTYISVRENDSADGVFTYNLDSLSDNERLEKNYASLDVEKDNSESKKVRRDK